ncbi:hypothetical protein GCM10027610_023210 [Dactylosporangium cerinum]
MSAVAGSSVAGSARHSVVRRPERPTQPAAVTERVDDRNELPGADAVAHHARCCAEVRVDGAL